MNCPDELLIDLGQRLLAVEQDFPQVQQTQVWAAVRGCAVRRELCSMIIELLLGENFGRWNNVCYTSISYIGQVECVGIGNPT